MNDPVDLRALLEQLRQAHHQCEDSWYSCPKNPEGCADEREKDCTCGADEHNALIDSALRSLTQPQEAPVCDACHGSGQVLIQDAWPDSNGDTCHPEPCPECAYGPLQTSPDYASRVRGYLALRAKATPPPWVFQGWTGQKFHVEGIAIPAWETFLIEPDSGTLGRMDVEFIAASHTAADLLEEGLRIMEGKA